MAQALLFGKLNLYLQGLLNDALVGMMTIEVIVLYLWTILRAKTISPPSYVSLLPVIGFGLDLLSN
jgi:hypothetical protein